MKVYIKMKGHRRYFIPVPMPLFILRLGLSGYVKRIIMQHTDANARRYIECIDFDALYMGIKELKYYRGLKLVEVVDKEGTEVTVIV